MIITCMDGKEFARYIKTTPVAYTYMQTPAGLMRILATKDGIFQGIFVSLAEQLPGYQQSDTLDCTKILLVGTDFQIQVWKALLEIPAGVSVSYEDIAKRIGKPTAYRAVANAVGDNKIAYVIPCHRVLRKTGDICGYNWGVERKRALLKAENITIK